MSSNTVQRVRNNFVVVNSTDCDKFLIDRFDTSLAIFHQATPVNDRLAGEAPNVKVALMFQHDVATLADDKCWFLRVDS